MTNNMKKLMMCLTMAMAWALGAQAQTINGHVFTSTSEPVVDAIVTSPGCTAARTAADGAFTMEGVGKGSPLTVWHDGYYQRTVYVNDLGVDDLRIFLVEEDKTRYNETVITPFAAGGGSAATSTSNINRKDFALGALSIDNAIKGEVTGLQVTNKSGMTERAPSSNSGACAHLWRRTHHSSSSTACPTCPMPT